MSTAARTELEALLERLGAAPEPPDPRRPGVQLWSMGRHLIKSNGNQVLLPCSLAVRALSRLAPADPEAEVVLMLREAGITDEQMREMWGTARDTWIARLLRVPREKVRTARRHLGVDPRRRGGDPWNRDSLERQWRQQWLWVRNAVSTGARTE